MAETLSEAVVKIGVEGADKVKTAFAGIKSIMGDVHKALQSVGFAAEVAGALGLGASIAFAIKKYADFEAIQKDLKDALEVSGQEVTRNMEEFSRLGGAIAQLTPVSRAQTNELLESALAHGASAKEAESLTTAAIGLGKALRINASEALELMARQDDRAFTALGRLNREIANAITPAEKLAVVNRLAAQGMQQLEGLSDTIKGALTQLGQSVAGVYTKLGSFFAPMMRALIDHFKESAKWMNQLADTMIQFGFRGGDAVGKVGGVMSTLGSVFKRVFDWINEAIKQGAFSILNWGQTWQLVKDSTSAAIEYMGQRWVWFKDNFISIAQWIGTNWKTIWGHIMDYCGARLEQLVSLAMGKIHEFQGDLYGGSAFYDLAKSDRFSARMSGKAAESVNFGEGLTKLDLKEFAGTMSAATADAIKHDKAGIAVSFKEFLRDWDKNTQKSNKDMENVIKGVGGVKATGQSGGGSGGHFVSLTDIWKNTQMALLKPNRTEINTKETAGHCKQISAHLKTMLDRNKTKLESRQNDLMQVSVS